MCYPERNPDFDSGNLVLVMPDGSVIGNALGQADADSYCCVGFYDEYRYYYKEYIFDVSPEELEEPPARGLHFRRVSAGRRLGGELLPGG